MYLKGKILALDREVPMKETNKSATNATKAKKELEIANTEAKRLSGMVTKLQRRLDSLKGLGGAGGDRAPFDLGSSDEGWGPEPRRGRHRAPSGARCSDQTPSAQGSGGERDECLDADYCSRRGPTLHTRSPRAAGARPGTGRYGALSDEFSEQDMEWDIDGMEDSTLEPLLGFSAVIYQLP